MAKRHRPRASRAGLAAAALVVAALATALSVVPANAAPAPPARIVSTSPSITETLFALGLGDRVVAVSLYCRFPAEVSTRPRVGPFMAPDPERIARLMPDLVLLHPGVTATPAHLRGLGVRATTVGHGHSLAAVFSTIRQIGTATDATGAAEKLERVLRSSLDRVRWAVAGRAPVKVLVIVGRRTGTLSDIVAVGKGSYLDDLMAVAGGVNVLASVAVPYPQISMETVIGLSPDVIIDVGEMGESAESSERRRQTTARLWAAQTLVKAVRDQRVHAVVDEAFVTPGPRLVSVARTMAEWFHGVRAR